MPLNQETKPNQQIFHVCNIIQSILPILKMM